MSVESLVASAFARLVSAINAVDAKTGGGGSDPWSWAILAANSVASAVTFTNVTGMLFAVAANKTYLVELRAAFQSAATTTGIGLALDIPAGAVIIGQNVNNISATALAGTEQIADATTTGATSGVRAINTNTPISAWFIVKTGANAGTAQLLLRSEIAASNVTLQAGITTMAIRELPA